MHASAEASGDSSGGSSGRPPVQQQQPAPGPHPAPTAQQLQQMLFYQQMLSGQFDVARWAELAAATPAPMYQASMGFAHAGPPLHPAQPQLPTAQAQTPAPMYQAPKASAHAGPPWLGTQHSHAGCSCWCPLGAGGKQHARLGQVDHSCNGRHFEHMQFFLIQSGRPIL